MSLPFAHQLGSLFYPACCLLCHASHQSLRHWVCDPCYAGLCALPLAGQRDIRLGNGRVLPVFSRWLFDDPVQKLIHALKYARHFSLAGQLGEELARRFGPAGWDMQGCTLVPVPLHKRRLEERGFNQSEKLARAIAKETDPRLKVVPLVRRVRYTQSQTQLSSEQRQQNVAGAFALSRMRRKQVAGARLVLVDDVLTTGATLQACAHILLDSGAAEVRAITIARAHA